LNALLNATPKPTAIDTIQKVRVFCQVREEAVNALKSGKPDRIAIAISKLQEYV
jgi:hypothetical protein